MRDPQAEPSDLIRSVSRAFQVLEAVGQSPRGLTVKQIARRCELTVATTYHLVRTLAYEGYVMRREDGTYIVGLEVADRFRELVLACRGPQQVQDVLRKAAADTGFTHMIGRFINNRVAIVAVAEGMRSPYAEDLIVGFDDGAHATALGKALLATLSPDQRFRFVKESRHELVHAAHPHFAGDPRSRPDRGRTAGPPHGGEPVPRGAGQRGDPGAPRP